MKIDWDKSVAAIWRQRKEYLRPVQNIDPITLDELIGIDNQKQHLLDNTRAFIRGQPCNNALLWGARGTGKSSLVKAILNQFNHQGLRLIEVDKDDLIFLPEIVDDIRELDYRFILYCDDLSFEAHENNYKHLKSVMEGSIELPPENILIYATSNRRHLLPETMSDNLGSEIVNGELHYKDAVEEKISLSDRFGMWLSFYPMNYDKYLAVVDSLFPDYSGDREKLHEAAKLFSMTRGAKSGRTARQFFNSYKKDVL